MTITGWKDPELGLDAREILGGITPEIQFPCTYSCDQFLGYSIVIGRGAVKLFKTWSFGRRQMDSGILPVNQFTDMSKSMSSVRFHISSGCGKAQDVVASSSTIQSLLEFDPQGIGPCNVDADKIIRLSFFSLEIFSGSGQKLKPSFSLKLRLIKHLKIGKGMGWQGGYIVGLNSKRHSCNGNDVMTWHMLNDIVLTRKKTNKKSQNPKSKPTNQPLAP
ncbi:hypothetical protein CFP56_019737 [Quercus suber]|uniref:Uncharacterized protein n=1 Tax=Quercus suber TaxID=58331 RepID=A0AAW0M320_QUESU